MAGKPADATRGESISGWLRDLELAEVLEGPAAGSAPPLHGVGAVGPQQVSPQQPGAVASGPSPGVMALPSPGGVVAVPVGQTLDSAKKAVFLPKEVQICCHFVF